MLRIGCRRRGTKCRRLKSRSRTTRLAAAARRRRRIGKARASLAGRARRPRRSVTRTTTRRRCGGSCMISAAPRGNRGRQRTSRSCGGSSATSRGRAVRCPLHADVSHMPHGGCCRVPGACAVPSAAPCTLHLLARCPLHRARCSRRPLELAAIVALIVAQHVARRDPEGGGPGAGAKCAQGCTSAEYELDERRTREGGGACGLAGSGCSASVHAACVRCALHAA